MANPPPYSNPMHPEHQPAPGYPHTYQPGYPPEQPPSYQGGAPPGYQPIPAQSTHHTTYIQQPAPPVHLISGNCPVCQRGMLRDQFTVAGLCLAFWFFPIGILCCLAMTEKRCNVCGFVFCG